MELEKYLENAPELNEKCEYWFIRTDSGNFYDTFRENGFIALGWDEITVENIKDSIANSNALRNKIQKLSESYEETRAKASGQEIDRNNIIDLNTKSGKSKSSMVINKLQNFYNLKYGDVVVIPSYGSSRLSFGTIADSGVYVDNDNSLECSYRKRRKVNWVTHKRFEELDTIFFNLKRSMHAISSVKTGLAEHIDRVMHDIYFKDGYGHYVIRVKKKEDINAQDLFELGGDLMKLLSIINEQYAFNEPVNETVVKINVQSNGDILLKGKVGNSIIALSLIVSLAACDTSKKPEATPKSKEEKALLDNIKKRCDSLEIEVKTR